MGGGRERVDGLMERWDEDSRLWCHMTHSLSTFAAGSEVEYIHQACKIMQMSLQHLAFVLRAALLAKLEEGKAMTSSPPLHTVETPSAWERLEPNQLADFTYRD